MRTFAQVDENNIVVNVATFEDDLTPVDLDWPNWYETAPGIRRHVAAPDFTFVPEADGYPLGLFYPPCPHNTWVLNSDWDWEPPADKPFPEGIDEPDSLWWGDDVIEDWVEKTPGTPPE